MVFIFFFLCKRPLFKRCNSLWGVNDQEWMSFANTVFSSTSSISKGNVLHTNKHMALCSSWDGRLQLFVCSSLLLLDPGYSQLRLNTCWNLYLTRAAMLCLCNSNVGYFSHTNFITRKTSNRHIKSVLSCVTVEECMSKQATHLSI